MQLRNKILVIRWLTYGDLQQNFIRVYFGFVLNLKLRCWSVGISLPYF